MRKLFYTEKNYQVSCFHKMRLPIFPLNGAILFPGTNLPLNIFEERYIQMVDYTLSNNRLIGMIQKKADGKFFNIGCVGKITNFTETEDGKYQISLQGLDRFYFKKILKTSYKFLTIDAEIVEQKNIIEKNKNEIKEKLLSNFNKFLKEKKINFNISEFKNLDSISLAKIICVISPLDYLIKQMLLECEEGDLCNKLFSVLEIEMQNSEKNLKIN